MALPLRGQRGSQLLRAGNEIALPTGGAAPAGAARIATPIDPTSCPDLDGWRCPCGGSEDRNFDLWSDLDTWHRWRCPCGGSEDRNLVEQAKQLGLPRGAAPAGAARIATHAASDCRPCCSAWRCPCGGSEDRNIEVSRKNGKSTMWRCPCGGSEDRNWVGLDKTDLSAAWRCPCGGSEDRNSAMPSMSCSGGMWRCPCGGSEDRNPPNQLWKQRLLLVALPLRGQRGSQPASTRTVPCTVNVALPLRGQRGSQPGGPLTGLPEEPWRCPCGGSEDRNYTGALAGAEIQSSGAAPAGAARIATSGSAI